MKSDIIDNRNKSTMIRQLITEFPLSDVPKERTVTEEKIRKYTLHQRGSRCTDCECCEGSS